MPTLNATFKILDGFSAPARKASQSLDKMVLSLDSASEKMDKTADKMDVTASRISEVGDSFTGLRSVVEQMSITFTNVTSSMTKAANQMQVWADNMANAKEESQKTDDKTKGLIDTAKNLTKALAACKAVGKVIEMTDTYTNMNARLSLITDNLEEQKELQDAIYASSKRARGSYIEMSEAVSKLSLLAGDSFNNNNEAVMFSELLTKSLKISGAGAGEQSSAFLQLTQAMASGRLQGDEFTSIMENAPMVAQAISDYMGVTKGELKEMSSEGKITSDIIKNAMFAAAGDINDKFEQMPMTFSDAATQIKSAATRAFSNMFDKINSALNSEGAQKAISNLIGLIYLAGNVISGFIAFCVNNWPLVRTAILAVVAALIVYNTTSEITVAKAQEDAVATAKAAIAKVADAAATVKATGAKVANAAVTAKATIAQNGLSKALVVNALVTAKNTIAQNGFNKALSKCPLSWALIGLIAIVAAVNLGIKAYSKFTGISCSTVGVVMGAMAAISTFFANIFIGGFITVYNTVAEVVNLLYNLFTNSDITVMAKLYQIFHTFADTILGALRIVASAIDAILNTDFSANIDSWRKSLDDFADEITDGKYKEFMPEIDSTFELDYSDMINNAYNAGEWLDDKLSGLFEGYNTDINLDTSDAFDGITDPIPIEGTGVNGTVDVNMADEDIEYLRDLARRDYIAKVANNTLAPNVRIEFTGPVTKEADVDKVATRVGEILEEQIATTAEGVY